MVVILGPTNNYIGGGVLVSPRHVVTAAHKVANFGWADWFLMTLIKVILINTSNYREGAGLKVRLGEWDAKANVEPLKYVELNVIRQKVLLFKNQSILVKLSTTIFIS